MRQCMDADNLHRRLKKIIGQIQAIDRMVDEDIPCEDVLAQINAAKSALHRVGQVVLEGHINHCVRDGIEHGDADKTIANQGRRALCQHDLIPHSGYYAKKKRLASKLSASFSFPWGYLYYSILARSSSGVKGDSAAMGRSSTVAAPVFPSWCSR